MKLEDIKNIDFWAREYVLPLFWLADENFEMLKDDILVLYKESRLHVYFLNSHLENEQNKGFEEFSQENSIDDYKEGAEGVLSKLTKLSQDYSSGFKDMDNESLVIFFKELMDALNEYSNHYTKTEDARLRKFEENVDEEVIKRFKKIGELRLKMRKEGEGIFYSLMEKFLIEISKRYNIPIEYLNFFTQDEFISLLKGIKIDSSIIQERMRGYGLWKMNREEEIITGDDFIKLWDWVDSRFVKSKRTSFSGRVANKGKVQGVVRVILHDKPDISKDVNKFKQGEILVSEMTRPATILACRKAAAIITDEGGIICHAAIISRELDIPCIVGANIATEVLKDGDEVEVDADNGIVKILKSYE